MLIYGPTKTIRTDLGKEYKNELIKELCTLMKIEQKFSTAYHHEIVGTVERNHGVFNEYLRTYLNGNMDNWNVYLRYFTYAYNTQKHTSNGEKYRPFELIFSKRPVAMEEILNENVDPIYNVDGFAILA